MVGEQRADLGFEEGEIGGGGFGGEGNNTRKKHCCESTERRSPTRRES